MITKKTLCALILAELTDNQWTSGRDLRHAINAKRPWWGKCGGIKFYGFMHELEEAGLIRCWRTHDEYHQPFRNYQKIT